MKDGALHLTQPFIHLSLVCNVDVYGGEGQSERMGGVTTVYSIEKTNDSKMGTDGTLQLT